MIKYALPLIAMVVFATSAYATALTMTSSNVMSMGTGSAALPTNIVEVPFEQFLNNGGASTGNFNQVRVHVTASVSATYTVVITVYVNGAFVTSYSSSHALSGTSTTITTSTFTTQTLRGNTVEVDVVATG
jgi:hypothetical protein